ncbi:MAG TPA: ABC transporter permease [Planctomycetota bacterium]|nr:ABC transporter permease [Planctomycetota bacterium]
MTRRALLAIVPPLAGLLFALLIGAIVVRLTGKAPTLVVAHLWNEMTAVDAGEVIYLATVYIFTGLSVAYAFQAGLFNIGGEGQLMVGGFVMGVLGVHAPGPSFVAVPLCLVAGFAGGAAWAALPAVLRAWRNVHEVVTTILMNLIAGSAASFFLLQYRAAHKDVLKEAMHTLPIADGAQVRPLEALFPSLEGSHASTLIFLALACSGLVSWIVWRTRTGYELRATGANPLAAHAAGISIPVVMTKALLVSGGLSGLAAAPFVLANNHYYEQDMLAGAGFTGIAVAVLAGNDALRVVLAAFLMAALAQAGELVNGSKEDCVPKEIVIVLQAVVIVSVLVAQGVARRMVLAAQARRAGHE